MFIPKKFEKYTNYNGYICDKRRNAHEVDNIRLLKVIDKLTDTYKNPYIRFMWAADTNNAMCVVYSDLKKNMRMTKLVPFDKAEELIMG